MFQKPTYEELLRRVQELEQLESAYNKLKQVGLHSQNYLEKLNNSLREALFTVKLPERVIEYTNTGVERIFGYSPDECLGRSTKFLYPNSASYDEFGKKLHSTIAEKKASFKTEHTLQRKSNEPFTAEITTTFIQDKGKITQVISIIRDITDHRLSEENLQNSELKFRLMAESIQDIFWMSTRGVGEMLYISPAYEKLWGRSQESLYQSPRSFLEAIHPDDLPEYMKIIQGAHKEGRPYACEYRIHAKDGQRWILERGFPVQQLWKGKEIMTGVCTDITDKKQAEESLKASENRFRQLFENISSGVAVYGATENGENFIFKDLNKKAEKIDQISKKEVMGKPIADVFPGIVAFGLFDVLKGVWQTGEPRHCPVALYEDDRIKGWRENYIYKLPSGEIVAIYDDVTERKQTETSLRESEERFRELAELLPETIFEMDIAGNLTFVNHKAFEHFKFEKSDFDQGLKALDMIAPKDRPKIERNITKIFQGENIGLKEYQALRKDGTSFPALFHSSAIVHDGEPVGLRGFIIDMSEKQHLEAQLLQTQKMESIGILAGGIAHDFNNILASIIGFTQLALKGATPGTTQEKDLLEVCAASGRAKELVRQILAFARQTDEPMMSIRIDVIIKEVLKFIRSSIPATIEIKQKIDSKSFVMGNTTQIHQIVMNLCTNAAQAMNESGGVLKVDMKDVAIRRDSKMADEGVKPGDYIEIKVSDTGTGIPPDIIDSIFDPYFTTKKINEGTGMGLSVVQGIVKKSGGAISVNSRPEEGTAFSIYLPITKKPQLKAAHEPDTLLSGCEKILFVDDEVPIAVMGKRILENLGYSVETRTSSIEALEVFREKADSFDLVITDMTMPKMTGDKLAVELMKIRPDIPIILCTGFSKNVSEERISGIGIKAITYKPLFMADLAKTVRTVIDDAKS